MCTHRAKQSPRGINIAENYQSLLKLAMLIGKTRLAESRDTN